MSVSRDQMPWTVEVLGKIIREVYGEIERLGNHGLSRFEAHGVIRNKLHELSQEHAGDRSMVDDSGLLVLDMLDQIETACHVIRKAYVE